MGKTIYAEQVLHGYANGHQLLASSYVLELSDRKKMDELSDLSGRHNGEDFINYYTGYPIEEGKKYVISKTWYAHEMMRPGCVWTHSLIFSTEELRQLSDISRLIDSFCRPTNLDYEVYTHPVTFFIGEEKNFPSYNIQWLQYEIFTVCSSATPKCVSVDTGSTRLENELFMVLCGLPPEILRTFTFCTMSYDVRRYGDSLFQYQIFSETERNRLSRYYSPSQICQDPRSIKKYPYWIQCYMQSLLQDKLEPLYGFMQQYGADNVTLECFSPFARLYFALTGEAEISLGEYINSMDVLFPSNQSISQKTAELILDDQFIPKSFTNQEYQILEIIEMKSLFLQKSHQKTLGNKIIRNTPEKIYPYLKRYISGELPPRICDYLEDIIQSISPNVLREVSNMDRNICFVLIRKNPELLLCPDIWRQTKDFQQDMVYAINQSLELEKLEKLLVIVLRVDTENIAEDFYRVFGDQLFPALYGALRHGNLPRKERLSCWTPILLRKPRLLIEEILALPNVEWRRELFLQLNMNTDGLAQNVRKSVWLRLYREFFAVGLSGKNRIDIAIQFLPAIFCTNYHFEDGFIQNIVGTVYQEAKTKKSFDAWNRFQHILPQVEDYQSWDKCLRIRRALEERGYRISLVEPQE